jgi:class 3 adenylate cyclase/GGDEF domain-containing protein
MNESNISVLFADIKGYTTISKSVSPTDLEGLLDNYIKTMSSIIEHFNGRIDKIMGDGIIALFEPQGEEPAEHTYNAALATLDMQNAVTNLRDDWQQMGAGVDLIVRIGLATGDVVIGEVKAGKHEEYTALGDAVNLASRLQERATPGTVLACQQTHGVIGAKFPCRVRPNLEIKGYDDVYDAYEITGMPTKEYAQTSQTDSTSPSDDDLRRSQRQPLSIDITFVGAKGLQTHPSINISEGGVFIQTAEPEPIGAQLRIAAKIPTNRGTLPMVLTGQVVRHGSPAENPGMGVRFLAIQAETEDTINYFANSVYHLSDASRAQVVVRDGPAYKLVFDTPQQFPEAHGRALTVHIERISSGDIYYFEKRLLHEFDRTRRYQHEFSCVAVRIVNLDKLDELETLEETLIEIADLLSASVRTTDEVFYFKDGLFFILAPETMANRVSTLTRRIVEAVHTMFLRNQVLAQLSVSAGAFSFDGHNADRPQDILKNALSHCD